MGAGIVPSALGKAHEEAGGALGAQGKPGGC